MGLWMLFSIWIYTIKKANLGQKLAYAVGEACLPSGRDSYLYASDFNFYVIIWRWHILCCRRRIRTSTERLVLTELSVFISFSPPPRKEGTAACFVTLQCLTLRQFVFFAVVLNQPYQEGTTVNYRWPVSSPYSVLFQLETLNVLRVGKSSIFSEPIGEPSTDSPTECSSN